MTLTYFDQTIELIKSSALKHKIQSRFETQTAAQKYRNLLQICTIFENININRFQLIITNLTNLDINVLKNDILQISQYSNILK